VHISHKIETVFKFYTKALNISRQYQDNNKTMFSNLTTSEIALKVINVCLLLIILLIKLYGDTETPVNNKVNEEEKKDINTWYPTNDEQSRYKGEWKGNVPHGKGTKEVFKSDSCGQPPCWSIIEGSFVNGFAEGYCKQTYKQEDGQSCYYEGEFHNDKHHGQGSYYYEDGAYHKGSFTEGYEHGVGYYYKLKTNQTWVGEFDKNRKTRGRWIDGELM
jgi:hypothetical protein